MARKYVLVENDIYGNCKILAVSDTPMTYIGGINSGSGNNILWLLLDEEFFAYTMRSTRPVHEWKWQIRRTNNCDEFRKDMFLCVPLKKLITDAWNYECAALEISP
ncbi:TPA: hypothetical protein DEP94_03835 [Candidatus Nomurabacteria bacterium]|nr:hypothetical protein [Candidatus Nomurabacteria bacterium]